VSRAISVPLQAVGSHFRQRTRPGFPLRNTLLHQHPDFIPVIGGYSAVGRSWMIQLLPSGSEKKAMVLHGWSLRPGTWTPFS